MKIVKQWVQENSNYIREKVIEYNQKHISDEEKKPSEKISFIVRNEKEEIVGGITAITFWHHVHVDFLWVSEEYRHEGYGSQLIKLIEEFAIENECKQIDEIQGEKQLNISFDGRFMMDALKAIKEETVTLSFSGSMRPILIETGTPSAAVHLISPVRAY